MKRNTIIGQHALVIAAAGEKELASQIFNYEDLREVRLDLEKLEVTVLMTYDDSYFRVFKIELNDEDKKDEAKMAESKKQIAKFYNDLLNASMRLTKDEMENIKKHREELVKASKETKEEK